MSDLYFSPKSRLDLHEILEHVAEHNPEAAIDLISQITESCRRLARFPAMGVARDDLFPCLRYFPVGKHLIFYRHSHDVVEIVRILHSSRDYINLLK